MKPSEYAEREFFVKKGRRLILRNRPYLWPIYNAPTKRIFMLGGRQIEKSTTILVKLLINIKNHPGFNGLYVSPLEDQAKRIAKRQYKDIERATKSISKLVDRRNSSIRSKYYKNGSSLIFGYASYTPDRLRNISSDMNVYDEIQDMLIDNIPVIRESLTHSAYKYEMFAGTAKLDVSPTAFYWKRSTGNDWAFKCPHCGKYQFITPKNIGKEGPICAYCKMPVTVHDILGKDSLWVSTQDPNSRVAGYRINQLMNPDIASDWDSFLFKWEAPETTEEKRNNEIFGYHYGSGERPFSEKLLQALAMEEQEHKRLVESKYMKEVFMGIDWGGEDAFTAYTVFGFPRYINEAVILEQYVFESNRDEETQLNRIAHTIRKWNVAAVGVDVGMGFDRNPKLMRMFPGIVKPFYYSGSFKGYIGLSKREAVFVVNRTRAMSQAIDEIKKKKLRLPPWSMFGRWANHFTSVYRAVSRSSTGIERVYYDHDASDHDDLFHSVVFARLAYAVYSGNYIDYEGELKSYVT